MSQQPPPGPSVPGPHGLLIRPVRTVGFWAAVLLPLAYPPALYLGDGTGALLSVGVLLVVHLCALAVGHGHRPG